jgi:chromosome segregation ATPase
VHKSIDSLKREVHIAQKKQQNVQTQLNSVKYEVEEFQKEKQGKLNSINISVLLRAEQVKHLVDMEVLPTYADLSKGLIFHNESLCKLESRIDEVEEEKKRLNQENLQLKKQHSQLEKDRREKETRIANLEQKAHEVQLSKFGQEIDLEKVDRMGTSEEVEKLEWRLRKQREEQDDELKRWDDAIEEAQQELDRLTRENTRKVETIIDHSSEQQKLDTQASQKKKHLFHDPVAARQKEVEERDRLRNTVNKQAEELKSLREDIKLMAEAS